MTVSNTIPEHDLNSLPQWAQTLIHQLTSQVHQLTARVQELEGQLGRKGANLQSVQNPDRVEVHSPKICVDMLRIGG